MTAFWLILGMFIGWNLPQPKWAKTIQQALVNRVKAVFQ
jgi:hypothetical protein